MPFLHLTVLGEVSARRGPTRRSLILVDPDEFKRTGVLVPIEYPIKPVDRVYWPLSLMPGEQLQFAVSEWELREGRAVLVGWLMPPPDFSVKSRWQVIDGNEWLRRQLQTSAL